MFNNKCSNGSGIYLIVNLTKDKIYIGQSSNMKRRINSHINNAKQMRDNMQQDIVNGDLFLAFDLLIVNERSRRDVVEHTFIYNLNYYNQNSKRFKNSTGLTFKKYAMYNSLLTNALQFSNDEPNSLKESPYDFLAINTEHIKMVQYLDIVHKNIRANSRTFYEELNEEVNEKSSSLKELVNFRIRLDEDLIDEEEYESLFDKISEV